MPLGPAFDLLAAMRFFQALRVPYLRRVDHLYQKTDRLRMSKSERFCMHPNRRKNSSTPLPEAPSREHPIIATLDPGVQFPSIRFAHCFRTVQPKLSLKLPPDAYPPIPTSSQSASHILLI
ncbi:hypothetical protein BDN72DRAFT_906129 [Pluteus cervinus]|uniref:Uncharacterized protein n=1 Tax=Pluteus cervinus TaxID=181527 RepID=A0ACD3A0C2_9AGAR|nr:hypothetical protein BDN72DRAFT_906129 [Pluteus cervinus]